MYLPVHFPVPKIELFNKVQLNHYKALVNYSFEILLLHNVGRSTHSCAMQGIRSSQLNSKLKYSNHPWIYLNRFPKSFIPFVVFVKTTAPSIATSLDVVI